MGLPCLPPTLTALTQLRRLDIDPFRLQSRFNLTREDVDTILRRLPCLTQLRMPWMCCTKPPVMLHLFTSLPQLQVPQGWH